MKTLIIYTSKHGSSEKAAYLLKEALKGNVEIMNIRKEKLPLLDNFDSIIIGGSIHAGKIQSRISEFCTQQTNELMKKNLGLYICCMDKNKAEEQFNNAYKETLRMKAIACGIFGGEFNFERMNWFEKAIVRKVAKTDKTISDINTKAIQIFAEKFNTLSA